jgi:hypothetical protein
VAFGHGDDALAITLLGALPPSARRLGGSQAQRDVLRLTLDRSVQRARGSPAGRRRPAQASGMYM